MTSTRTLRRRLSKAVEYTCSRNLRPALSNFLHKDRQRVLMPHPMPLHQGHSPRRINLMLERLPRHERYLEVGLLEGHTFENVRAPVRWGVDPCPLFNLDRLPPGATVKVATSDRFFEELWGGESFDFVFLDGLHTFRQTYRDLINAFRVCPKGIILVDDVVPVDEVSAMPDRDEAMRAHERLALRRDPGIWHGDVFKVLLLVAGQHPEVSFRTIVGDDNAQAVVWRPRPDAVVQAVDSILLDEIDRVSYGDVFANGVVPNVLQPTSERHAIADAVEDLAPTAFH